AGRGYYCATAYSGGYYLFGGGTQLTVTG
nr:Ig lambda chain V region (clone pDH9) - rabbit [Oryctolagus cuniculus]